MIRNLKIERFKSLVKLDLELGRVNVFIGANGSGKSNLLEAIGIVGDPLRIALVAEGPTDGVVIEASLRAILQTRQFILTQIFPEGSVVFGKLGAGWGGVYRW